MKPTQERTCLHCHKKLHGRIDKKFCDDYCRNTFNNQAQATEDGQAVKTITAILKKNRKILQHLLKPQEEITHSTKQKLTDLGFNFQYFTHNYTTKKGNTYFFIFEYGYLIIEVDRLLIVKRNDEK